MVLETILKQGRVLYFVACIMAIPDDLLLRINDLTQGYSTARFTPEDVVRQIYRRLQALEDPGIFIHLVPEGDALRVARQLGALAPGERGALYGIPFAVKDNIDVAGLPTTAACPDFSYIAKRTALAVERLLFAGAILIGKTNLDQFATGLVGVRSPYPPPRNTFDRRFIPGGSSSGSAVAVAAGLATFALGTDTAGSGRVPAAMNNIVGAKPTRGLVSTQGVVPACRAQDCVSVFALSVADTASVLEVMKGFEPLDPYSRVDAAEIRTAPEKPAASFRCGIPERSQLVFSDEQSRLNYESALEVLRGQGAMLTPFDFTPFAQIAGLLYGGPWVAQRLEATQTLLQTSPDSIYPITRNIIESAKRFSAADVYEAEARFQALARDALRVWDNIDVIAVPTIPGPVTVADVTAEPIAKNSLLGTYTNFVNLLNLCAIAIPTGVAEDGIPRGLTLIAEARRDAYIAGIGQALHLHPSFSERQGLFHSPSLPNTWAKTTASVAGASLASSLPTAAGSLNLVVAGAHMSGQPLNRELQSLGARLVRPLRTAPCYRLFALDTSPRKPGLVRVNAGETGYSIACEQWALEPAALGQFVSSLPKPMCVGEIQLEDGSRSLGFLCEPFSLIGATEISEYGSWPAFLASST